MILKENNKFNLKYLINVNTKKFYLMNTYAIYNDEISEKTDISFFL